jgi:hypothetical protein
MHSGFLCRGSTKPDYQVGGESSSFECLVDRNRSNVQSDDPCVDLEVCRFGSLGRGPGLFETVVGLEWWRARFCFSDHKAEIPVEVNARHAHWG